MSELRNEQSYQQGGTKMEWQQYRRKELWEMRMSDTTFYVCIFILLSCWLLAIILCAGTPDLLDAITAYVLSLSKVCP